MNWVVVFFFAIMLTIPFVIGYMIGYRDGWGRGSWDTVEKLREYALREKQARRD